MRSQPADVSTDTLSSQAARTLAEKSGGLIAPGLPSGCMMPYAGASAPTGFLLCQGQSLDAATYETLFAAIGYTYGGAGANFNVPDCRGRTIIGAGTGTGLTNRILGTTTGTETHVLLDAQMPSHNHSVTGGGHQHNLNRGGDTNPNITGGGSQNVSGVTNATTTDAGTHSHTVGTAGSDSAHPNMQPSLACNMIIKT